MRIILDGMGGDNAPRDIVKGAVMASELINDEICIVGKENLIKKELKRHKYDKTKITVEDASQVIEMDEAPVKAVRTKKDSSMVVGLHLVKDNEADAFVSAGNSGALLRLTQFLKRELKHSSQGIVVEVQVLSTRLIILPLAAMEPVMVK